MLRNPMPNRRMSENHRLPVGEAGKQQTFFVTLGMIHIGDRLVINEVFMKHGKEGQALDAICDDAGILISQLLQMGFPVADLCGDMSRLPTFDHSGCVPTKLPVALPAPIALVPEPASIIGAVLHLIAREQASLDQARLENALKEEMI